MARLDRHRNIPQLKSSRNWLLYINTALLIGLYVIVLLEKLKWIG